MLVSKRIAGRGAALLAALLSLLIPGWTALAGPAANRPFLDTWARTDRPVAALEVSRTWMWGPEAFTGALLEPYAEAPDGQRVVQYYDKSRMEITHPERDRNSIWYVTNGLLVRELVSGRIQLGDNRFEQYEAAEAHVVGDFEGVEVSYAVVGQNLAQEPYQEGELIDTYYDWYSTAPGHSGEIVWEIHEAVPGGEPDIFTEILDYDVRAARFVPETNHTIAAPFWEFMNGVGPVYEGGQLVEGALFQNPFFATGFPISEPNWTLASVGGQERWVLFQCFERRCLTYTPDNDPGWQVESGNVGRHYYEWRYEQLGLEPQPAPYPTSGDVRISFILADPVEFGESEGEYVDIQNRGDTPVDLSGWRLEDAAGNGYDFPDGFVIGLDATVRIHVCDGEDTASDLYWGRCSAVWNNDGDTGRLYDASGALVNEYSY